MEKDDSILVGQPRCHVSHSCIRKLTAISLSKPVNNKKGYVDPKLIVENATILNKNNECKAFRKIL
jgi:hypothetical protein